MSKKIRREPGDAPPGKPGVPEEPTPAPLPEVPEGPQPKPDFDPDIPEHPGPPLSDPESPRGAL